MPALDMRRQLHLGGHVHIVATHIISQSNGLVHFNLEREVESNDHWD